MQEKWRRYEYQNQSRFLDEDVVSMARPVLDVKLSTKASNITVTALVDSGTDSTLIDAEIAKALFISPGTCQKKLIKGAGEEIGIGEKWAFFCDLNVEFEGFSESFVVPVAFIENLPFQALLGQRGFFEHFDVRFSKSNNYFELMRVSKAK